MKTLLSVAGGLAAGALAMYYLDSRNGARRRAMVRDKVSAAGRDAADIAHRRSKHVADRVKGAMANRGRLPKDDAQLHERIRARLGHVVSHPKAIKVRVDQGSVVLTGQVLTSELEEVVGQIRRMPGVVSVHHQLELHDTPDDVPALQGLA